MMHLTNQKEDISISYLSALCAAMGISYEIIRHDQDSTDGMMMKSVKLDDGLIFDAQLRIQLKCTSSPSQYQDKGEQIVYRLKAKNYNDLRRPGSSPIILGLLVLPEDSAEWVNWTAAELLLRGCMYWKSLAGADEMDNESSIRINIAKTNVLNQDGLNELMEKIAKEDGL